MEVSILNVEMLIFLNESGCDNRDSFRVQLERKTSKKTEAFSQKGTGTHFVHNIRGGDSLMQFG